MEIIKIISFVNPYDFSLTFRVEYEKKGISQGSYPKSLLENRILSVLLHCYYRKYLED